MRDETKGLLKLLGVIALIMIFCFAAWSFREADSWPESAEFSQIESGADRFSIHQTNIAGWQIIVDHQTGIQYLFRYNYGITPLFEADGTMMRVLEAGE